VAHGVHLRRPVRALIAIAAYAGLVAFVSMMLITSPALALVSSPNKYDRVIHAAERIAHQHANKIANAATIAAAAKAASPVATAMRVVTGPVGWVVIGAQAGLYLYETFYSATDLTDLNNAAGQANAPLPYIQDLPSGSSPVASSTCVTTPTPSCQVSYNGNTYPADAGTYDGLVVITTPTNGVFTGSHPLLPYVVHPAKSPSNPPYVKLYDITNVTVNILDPTTFSQIGTIPNGGLKVYGHIRPQGPPPPPPVPTEQQIKDFLQTLPDTDPRSMDSHSKPLGSGVEPTPAAQVTTTTATPTELPTTVVPQTQVFPTDTVVSKDVPPPAGTTQTQTTTQATTTTTTTNPDGSQTEQQAATTQCASASHDQRTFGTVLQEHQSKWNNAPLLSALNQLKTLAWPSTLPTVSFNSLLFGSFAVDFNAWSWVFLTLKTLILAGASLAAYRIVFVGGR
jgi:hypothetical protein